MGGKWPRASGPAARLAPCPCGDGSGCRQACPTPVCLGLCGAEAVSWSQDQAGGVAGKNNSRGAPRPAVRSPLALPGTITAPVRRLLRCTWPTCWPWAARSRGPEAPPCSPSLAAVWAAALGRMGVQGLSTGPRFPTTKNKVLSLSRNSAQCLTRERGTERYFMIDSLGSLQLGSCVQNKAGKRRERGCL